MWVIASHSDCCQRNLWWLIAGRSQIWIQIEALWAIRAPIKNSELFVIVITIIVVTKVTIFIIITTIIIIIIVIITIIISR